MSDWRSWDFGFGFKKVLRKYYPDMVNKINPKEILPYLPSLLCSASDEVCEFTTFIKYGFPMPQ